ncbi:zinc finger, CCHC-type containing protein [Tanacetum coccineum]
MAVAAMKHMASNFAKLDKFEGVDFRRWQKKMHFLLSSMSVVYVLTTPMPEDGGDDATVKQIRKRAMWDNDDYVCRGLILNGMSDSLFDIYQNVESSKELWDSLEAKYMVEDASSKKFLVSNFTNYKMTNSRPVLEQYNELLGILGRFTKHKMNMDEAIQVFCIIDKLSPSWKDFKHTLKHLKEELTIVELGSHLRIEESLRVQDSDKPKGNIVAGPSVVNMVKHSNFSRYNDNKGKRKHHNTKADPNKKPKVTCWKFRKPEHLKKDCKGVHVGNKANGSGIKGSVDGSSNSLKGSIVHVCKDRCWSKTYESLNDGSILHMGNESTALVHGQNKRYFVTFIDDASRFCYVYLLHSKDEALDKFKVFKTEVELQKGSLIKRFRTDRGCEYMDTLYFQSVSIIHETTAPILHNKMGSCKTHPDPKLKTLGERCIECIFVGYVEHSKAFRFYVIKPDDLVSINSIIESRDAIFDENRFSSVPRPSQRSLVNRTEDIGCSVVPKEVTEEVVTQQLELELRKGKRNRTPKNFGPEFQLYLIEGTRDEVSDQHSYCFNVEDDPKTFDEAMKSQKLKVNGTIEKFKARLVIQGFKQKSEIDYFDTYAPVTRISTIRLLIAMASIHNLIIYQMDVKTAFLNGDLDEEVYMNQPDGSN